MNEYPKISVLMPVYNSEKYLVKAVESVLAQTFTDFEFIIINDGSTDRSEEILRIFEKQDTRLRVTNRSNTGIVGALNEGLDYALGTYISRVDSDDIALPEMFAKQLAFLDSHPEYVAVGQRVLMIDPDDAPIRVANELLKHEDIDSAHMQGLGVFPHSGSMIRRDAMQKIGGYRKEMELAEDIDLWLRLAEIGMLANLPDVMFKYRLHPKSIGYARREQQVRATSAVIHDAHHRRSIPFPSQAKPQTTGNPSSIAETHRRWAWWALGDGNVATARKHAFKALLKEPFSIASWKVVVCSLRGW